MRTLVEVPRFSALDIKKIANMNPSKRSGPAINKKADLHKIAKMFKHVIQETTEDLLCSDLKLQQVSLDSQSFSKILQKILGTNYRKALILKRVSMESN